MKIGLKTKKTKGPEFIQRIEEANKVVSDAIQLKRKNEKEIIDKLDMGFYFSVVFSTRKERDAWLLERGLSLRDDDHILSSDLDKALAKQ